MYIPRVHTTQNQSAGLISAYSLLHPCVHGQLIIINTLYLSWICMNDIVLMKIAMWDSYFMFKAKLGNPLGTKKNNAYLCTFIPFFLYNVCVSVYMNLSPSFLEWALLSIIYFILFCHELHILCVGKTILEEEAICIWTSFFLIFSLSKIVNNVTKCVYMVKVMGFSFKIHMRP